MMPVKNPLRVFKPSIRVGRELQGHAAARHGLLQVQNHKIIMGHSPLLGGGDLDKKDLVKIPVKSLENGSNEATVNLCCSSSWNFSRPHNV